MPSKLIAYGKYMPDLPDLSDLNDPALIKAENVIPFAGSYQQFPALSAISTAMDLRCQGATAVNDSAGNAYIYAGTADKLYQIIGTTPTDESSGAYTLGTSGYWKFAQYRTTLIATNLTDAVQAATINSGAFAALAGSPPKAQCIGVVNLFTMLGNTSDPTNGNVFNRIQWSGIDDPTNWPTPATAAAFAAQAGQKILNPAYGRVMHIVGGLQWGLAFQERAIYRATYVGGGVVFAWDDFERTRGLYAPNGAVTIGTVTYYLAPSGFYKTDGQSVLGIGTDLQNGCAIDQTFLADLNISFLDRVCAGADPKAKVVFWAYPSTASTDGTPDKIVIYNYETAQWAYALQGCEYLFSAKSLGYTAEQLDSLSTNADSLTIPFDSPFYTGGNPLLGAFDTSHNYGTFGGAALTATFEQGEYQFTEGARSEYQGVKPLVTGTVAGGVTVQVASRQFQSDSVTYGSAITPSARSGIAPVRANNYYHRARTVITGGFDQAIGAEHTWQDSSPV